MRVGILGGGQLGRMLALAGYPLGVTFRVYDTTKDVPAADVAKIDAGDFSDAEALKRFAHSVDLVTYEFENVPVSSAEIISAITPVYPSPKALSVSQDRFVEKEFFREQNIPTADYYPISSEPEIERAVSFIGIPAVLKTRRMGYDGKGQFLVKSQNDITQAWKMLTDVPLILERWIAFERELSLIAVRNRKGQIKFYPLIENIHRNGILRSSLAPAPHVTTALQERAQAYAINILESLEYVGVLTIEFFESGGTLLANEMAPRVHNSGHWTIEGAATSQFENHVRAILDMPLGETTPRGVSLMQNIIGIIPAVEKLAEILNAHIHLYGKEPRPGRKLGHVTVCAYEEETLKAVSKKIELLLEK